ncbi:MAG: polyprenyl synthetase family protein [candidate division NC10 bacterium]|nr:polyprenyl synthetase family protein [candidate division NC10 bacterium]
MRREKEQGGERSFPLLCPIQEDLACVEEILSQKIDTQAELIRQAASYMLQGKGKRIRPALLLLSARLCGYRNGSRHIKLASIGEFLHVAALIHDDIIDNSHLRRGRPSANSRWGNALSVLVGDYLYSRSVKHLIEEEDLEVMRAFADATMRMVEGEVMEQEMAGRVDISYQDYMRMITHKTAWLFSACCRVGALISGAGGDCAEALTRFGLNLGVAFQIMDDALDFVADEGKLGKPVGKDLAEGRITFPLLYILEKGSSSDREVLKRHASCTPWQEQQATEVLSLVEKYQAVDWARGIAEEYAQEAKGCLSIFPPSEPKGSLLELADYILIRDR